MTKLRLLQALPDTLRKCGREAFTKWSPAMPKEVILSFEGCRNIRNLMLSNLPEMELF
jgi:hypothetical protein